MKIANNSMEVILASTTAVVAAQLFKFLWYRLQGKKVNFRILVQTGGMPSSHSACMMCMATSVGLIEGFQSTLFAVALGISFIVMYDAAGLRRAAGHMAGVLNKITEDIYSDHPGHIPERLRELLGHTPVEVLVGAFLGAGIAYAYHVRLLAHHALMKNGIRLALVLLALLTGTVTLRTAWTMPLPKSDQPGFPEHLLVIDWTESYRLYGQPHALWLDQYDHVGANETKLTSTLTKAAERKQYPEIVLYAIPLRDLGQSSEGGFASYEDYWRDTELSASRIARFVKDIKLIPRVYIEPDALSLAVQYRVDHHNSAESVDIYNRRIALFHKLIALYKNAGAKVYLEAGHSGWFDYGEENITRIAHALNEAGIDQADGLATNISNRQPVTDASQPRDEYRYLQHLLPRLDNKQLDVVVDTSRNGGKTKARQYYLAPNSMLIDSESTGGYAPACRMVGHWKKEDRDTLITPFFGKTRSLDRLLKREKYTFDAQKMILTAPAWLDAVGDVQPGPAPTDHPPAAVADVIDRYRYIKPPDDCDGALNCPPGASKHEINTQTAQHQPASQTGLPHPHWE